jgi:hypothetical protein
MTINPWIEFSKKLIRLNDESGLPLEMSLKMSKEKGHPVILIALLSEAVERNWSRRKIKNLAMAYKQFCQCTETETKAIDTILKGPDDLHNDKSDNLQQH